MTLTAEQIKANWDKFEKFLKFIKNPRKDKLLKFYNKHKERITMMPASYKKEYHNAFPGGYLDHVLRVTEGAMVLYKVWGDMGVDLSTFTKEELLFSALNHDLGKIGTEEEESYIPQTDQWRKDKLGEDYMFNKKVPFASVPDRGLHLLQSNGITYSFNEMVAIQTHDGLFDEANKKYFIGYLPEQKPRTCLPYILHQADIMASRIEFEKEWLPKFSEKKTKDKPKGNFKLDTKAKTGAKGKKVDPKSKALQSVKSENLKNILATIE